MRHLVWGRTDVEGGKRVEVKLPTLAPSAPDPKDYRDVVVLAFPATAGEWNSSLKPAKLTCATKRTAFLSAGCYTRPQDGKVVVQKALLTVLHSEWRARDGREAAVLANWTMEPQTYRLDFGGGKTVSGTLAAREWRLVASPHAEAAAKYDKGDFRP